MEEHMALLRNAALGALLCFGFPYGAAIANAAAQATSAGTTKVDDSTLRSRIVAKVNKDAALAERKLDVAVLDGVVTLKGTVRSAEEKAQAARLATIRGVKELHNEIGVDANTAKGSA